MIEYDSTSFAEALNQEQTLVIDFWAPWCMPCKILAPAIEELSDEMDGTATFGKVNIDECGELAQEYSVASIPTIVVFKDGVPVERVVGVRPKNEIHELVSRHV